jgi:outer membrane protein assembly factor BamB
MSAIRSRRLLQSLLGVSAVAIFLLAGAGSALAEVTGAADNLRTGWYPDEPSLTPSLLSGGGFLQAFKDSLKGQIYAQPLTADGVLLVATEENWVYGLDPNTGAVRWEKQFGIPVTAGENEGKTINCSDLKPHVGITGTPVIDTEHNVAYFVSNQYLTGSSTEIAWYMHAVELGSGKEVANFPVEIKGEAQNLPGVKFTAVKELQRPALLMMNGVVYAGFGSHCDHAPFQGWLVGVSTAGKLTTKWATSGHGGSIWQSGGGLVSDGPGQILFSTGNDEGVPGEWDPPEGPGGALGSEQSEGKFGESVVRAEVQPTGELKAKDFFSPFNNKELDEGDVDLGSSAPTGLPSQYFGTTSVPELLVQEGKEGSVYLLDRKHLGGRGKEVDNVVQKQPLGGVWGGASVWPGDGGYVYIPAVNGEHGFLHFFKYEVEAGNQRLSPVATTNESLGFGSGSPIVTSAGTTSGTAAVWITRCPAPGCENAELIAYSSVPSNGEPQPLWRAPIGTATKFSRPVASNGHIYVGNNEGDLYGFGHSESEEEREAREKSEREATEKTERETKEKGEHETKEKTEREATERTEHETKERTEREAKERTEREATQKSEPTGIIGIVTTASFVTPPGPPASVPIESPPSLVQLKIHAAASRLGSHRRKVVVTYTLSAAGTVEVAIYRRVISHVCRRGAGTCVHWVRTKIELKVAGHVGTNVLAVNLGTLAAGDYRMGAISITRSGASGIPQYVHFKTT